MRLKDIINDLAMIGISTKIPITSINFDTRKKSKRILLKWDEETKGWCICQEDMNAPVSPEILIFNL